MSTSYPVTLQSVLFTYRSFLLVQQTPMLSLRMRCNLQISEILFYILTSEKVKQIWTDNDRELITA